MASFKFKILHSGLRLKEKLNKLLSWSNPTSDYHKISGFVTKFENSWLPQPPSVLKSLCLLQSIICSEDHISFLYIILLISKLAVSKLNCVVAYKCISKLRKASVVQNFWRELSVFYNSLEIYQNQRKLTTSL